MKISLELTTSSPYNNIDKDEIVLKFQGLICFCKASCDIIGYYISSFDVKYNHFIVHD